MIQHALSNAALASAAAVVVFLCSRSTRNPSILHILWVAVLLRFLAPPLVNVPLGVARPGAGEAMATAPGGEQENAPGIPLERLHDPTLRTTTAPLTLSRLLVLIWGGGSALVLAVTIARVLSLQSLSRRAGVGDTALQLTVRMLGKEMGLRQTPKAFLVRARISPMVWSWFNRPVMLLPVELWGTLSDDEQVAVIRHELAHLVRRDHWVRYIEALATVTHWWCPVLWWARRELHRHEEQCCDGLAASSGPAARAALARACLQTIDFIGRKPAYGLQLGVSGMAGFHALRQRIDFILRGEHMQTLSWRVTIALSLAISLGLGVSPGFGDSDAPEREAKPIPISDTFESLRVVGGVDVAVRFAKNQKVTLAVANGLKPSFTVDDNKKLVITLGETPAKRAKSIRPKVVITTPKLVAVEAKNRAAVSVEKVKASVMVFAVEGHSRVAADGHCQSLTVTTDNSSTFLGKKMTAAAAVVSAKRKSAVSVGAVKSLVQNSDATSKVDVAGGSITSVRLSQQ